jgi:hypothetical protein
MASELLFAARSGDIARVRWLLKDEGASIDERNDHGDTALLCAASRGQYEMVKFLMTTGASIGEMNIEGMTALLFAVGNGHLPMVSAIVSCLPKEGVTAALAETNMHGNNALLHAADCNHVVVVQWLLEQQNMDITVVNYSGRTVWDMLEYYLVGDNIYGDIRDPAPVTCLLRVMVLRSEPSPRLLLRLSPEHGEIVHEGTRLRARLPAYLARRQHLVAEHSPLIAPLRALVHGYEELTTTEELWATGLGARTL